MTIQDLQALQAAENVKAQQVGQSWTAYQVNISVPQALHFSFILLFADWRTKQ